MPTDILNFVGRYGVYVLKKMPMNTDMTSLEQNISRGLH
jgi:hypothetical protein